MTPSSPSGGCSLAANVCWTLDLDLSIEGATTAIPKTVEPGTDRYTVRSVSRAIDVLEVVGRYANTDGMSVTDIAGSCELSKSAVFAVLQTLCARGFVVDDGVRQSRRYRLGPSISRLGDIAREQTSIRDIARPMLNELARQTGLPARLGTIEGTHVVVLDHVQAPRRMQVELRMLSQEKLYNTGLGKAILSFMPEAEVRDLIAITGMDRDTPRTIRSLEALLIHLAAARERGYAVDDEEGLEGVICIGSAVQAQGGRCVGAISVTGLTATVNALGVASIGTAAHAAASKISAKLGWDTSLN